MRNEIDRWRFLRDVVVFQLKLVLDAARDIALSPASLAAALLDVFAQGERPGRIFYRVLELGRRSEDWIDLFGGFEGAPRRRLRLRGSQTIDDLVAQVEDMLVEQVDHGGVTASAKQAIDRSLDRIANRFRDEDELEDDDQRDGRHDPR